MKTDSTALAATNANVTAIADYGGVHPVVFTGHSTAPYLKIDGEASTAQPPMAIYSIFVNGTIVHCIGLDGSVWSASLTGASTWDEVSSMTWDEVALMIWDDLQEALTPIVDAPTWNIPFMTAKFVLWANKRYGAWLNANTLYEFGASASKYELVPLGRFIADKPKKQKIKQIALTAKDNMSKFDKDATTFWADLAFPLTLGEIFAALCTFVGVTQATTTFINSTRSFAETPAQAEAITGRDVWNGLPKPHVRMHALPVTAKSNCNGSAQNQSQFL